MRFFLPGPRPSSRRVRPALAAAWALAAVAGVAVGGCSDGIDPEDLPFARTGEVRVQVVSPIPRPGTLEVQGSLQQTIVWHSNGTWRLTEQISYKGVLGDETVRASTEDAGVLATRYATWIGLVNAPGGAVELVDQLPPDLAPICDPALLQSVVTIELVDARRSDSVAWSRCGNGSLTSLSGENAGPKEDPHADRVIDAAKLARNATLLLDRRFNERGYAYTGSRPFKTVERGEDAKVPLVVPRVIEDAASLAAFWSQYMSSATQPMVDFSSEVVLVAAVGTRQEAGDSVEIRRVLPIEFGTRIELWERRPGNFCTPAPRVHAPFHIAVAPIAKDKRPIFFEVEKPDTIPCG